MTTVEEKFSGYQTMVEQNYKNLQDVHRELKQDYARIVALYTSLQREDKELVDKHHALITAFELVEVQRNQFSKEIDELYDELWTEQQNYDTLLDVLEYKDRTFVEVRDSLRTILLAITTMGNSDKVINRVYKMVGELVELLETKDDVLEEAE